jgi:hypothetical protein
MGKLWYMQKHAGIFTIKQTGIETGKRENGGPEGLQSEREVVGQGRGARRYLTASTA